MKIQENSLVVLKPLLQIPNYKEVNMKIYNQCKGRVLVAKNCQYNTNVFDQRLYGTKRFFTYYDYIDKDEKCSGGDNIVINILDGI